MKLSEEASAGMKNGIVIHAAFLHVELVMFIQHSRQEIRMDLARNFSPNRFADGQCRVSD